MKATNVNGNVMISKELFNQLMESYQKIKKEQQIQSDALQYEINEKQKAQNKVIELRQRNKTLREHLSASQESVINYQKLLNECLNAVSYTHLRAHET